MLSNLYVKRSARIFDDPHHYLKNSKYLFTFVCLFVLSLYIYLFLCYLQAPLTNAAAIGKSTNHHLTVLKDALQEIQGLHLDSELKEEKKGENLSSKDNEDDYGDDEDDFFDEDEEDDILTPEEYKYVPGSITLVQQAQALVKNLYMYILKMKFNETASPLPATSSQEKKSAQPTVQIAADVKWLETTLEAVSQCSALVDNLATTLLPPQKSQNVEKAIQELVSLWLNQTIMLSHPC